MMSQTSDTLRIEAIQVVAVRVPRSERNRITTAYARLPDAHHAIVRVRAGDVVGIGEAPAELWWTGEDAASVANAIERYLAPALINEPLAVRRCVRLMDAALAWNPYAKSAVEMALWDALARSCGVALHLLLGGGPARPIPIKYVIGIVEPEHARDEARRALEQGFAYLKVKVGGELAPDLARVRAVRDEVGDGVPVGVDVNGGWLPTTAIAALAPLAELGVSFLEQPVSSQYPAAMIELTRRSTIPVVAHESVFSVRDGIEAASRGLGHIWALTPSTHGGLVRTTELLSIARAAGIPCLLGSTVELGVATAFMAQIATAFSEIRECPVPSDIVGPLYHDGDVVTVQPVIECGAIRVPDGPGLGVELDESALAHFAAPVR